jgi:hypothetical protein
VLVLKVLMRIRLRMCIGPSVIPLKGPNYLLFGVLNICLETSISGNITEELPWEVPREMSLRSLSVP